MTEQKFYKTVLQVEILSEGEIVSELPADKLLSYLEYEGNFGHFSNYVTLVSSKSLSKEKLQLECAKHGTDYTFFTGDEDEESA